MNTIICWLLVTSVNFPQSYMQAGLSVLDCTDTATGIGKIVVDGSTVGGVRIIIVKLFHD